MVRIFIFVDSFIIGVSVQDIDSQVGERRE